VPVSFSECGESFCTCHADDGDEVTARYTRNGSGTPFSSCSHASSKASPGPARSGSSPRSSAGFAGAGRCSGDC
jgi:hypothetical protein